jgi:hypothetical protein
MSDEGIFREVDEALRNDRFRSLWDKYGAFVFGVAILIVVVVGGYNGWTYWQAKQASEAGERFMNALQLEEAGKREESVAAFQKLADDGPRGYRLLARFQVAAAFAKGGDQQGAVKAYDELAADRSVGDLMQGFAAIQAASLRVDEADVAEMKERLEALASGQSPWRHSARELLGLTAFRTGDNAQAEQLFGQLLADQNAPQNLKQRAEMMLALLVKSGPSAGGQ